MCLKNEQRLFRRVTGANALSWKQYYKEHESWVAEFCFGYWAFLFRSFSCSRCVRTARRTNRRKNMEHTRTVGRGSTFGCATHVAIGGLLARHHRRRLRGCSGVPRALDARIRTRICRDVSVAGTRNIGDHICRHVGNLADRDAMDLVRIRRIRRGPAAHPMDEHAHARSLFSGYGARLDHLGGCNRAGGRGVRIVGTVCRWPRGCRVRGVCCLAKHGTSADTYLSLKSASMNLRSTERTPMPCVRPRRKRRFTRRYPCWSAPSLPACPRRSAAASATNTYSRIVAQPGRERGAVRLPTGPAQPAARAAWPAAG